VGWANTRFQTGRLSKDKKIELWGCLVSATGSLATCATDTPSVARLAHMWRLKSPPHATLATPQNDELREENDESTDLWQPLEKAEANSCLVYVACRTLSRRSAAGTKQSLKTTCPNAGNTYSRQYTGDAQFLTNTVVVFCRTTSNQRRQEEQWSSSPAQGSPRAL
jgi:hypothetical protein